VRSAPTAGPETRAVEASPRDRSGEGSRGPSQGSIFSLPDIRSFTSLWDEKPTGGQWSASLPGMGRTGVDITPPRTGPAPSGPEPTAPAPAPRAGAATTAMASRAGPGQGAADAIDNSSRQAFVRTAWPHMLEAAGGNRDAAEMMLAAAISENGDIGKGGGFIGNNFFGIKGKGPAGSVNAATWEATPSGPVNIRDEFAAYRTPTEGFRGFFDFLRANPRYAGALTTYEQTGDADRLFRDVNAAGYATDQAWASKVANIRANQVAPITRELQARPAAARTAPPLTPGEPGGPPLTPGPVWEPAGPGPAPVRAPAAVPGAGAEPAPWTVNQLEAGVAAGLSTADALAICGPVALTAYKRANDGANPSLQEALQLSKATGWNPEVGMGRGSTGFIEAARQIGVPLSVAPVNWDRVNQAVGQGQVVTLNSHGNGGHFWTVQGLRDGPNGREYDFGNSAAVLKRSGGRRWLTPAEANRMGVGTIDEMILMSEAR
jgi:flagellum-specific peptidoglycan hydrolase FlgJ